MQPKSDIWLFRDAQPEDRYEAVFDAAGFTTRHIPVLTFEFISDWEPISNVDAIVVTSRRAAESLAANRNLDDRLPAKWRSLPWYSMGPSTSEALEALEVSITAHDARTGTELARVIIERNHRRVAFLAGNPHRIELPRDLRRAGIDVLIRIVYRAAPALSESLVDLPRPDWAAFFSPRGVEIVAGIEGPDWSDVNIVAIGPTTAAAVEEQGWRLEATAPRPTAGSLLHAVEASLLSRTEELFSRTEEPSMNQEGPVI